MSASQWTHPRPPEAPGAWAPRVSSRVLYLLGILLTAAFFCWAYWLAVPRLPPLPTGKDGASVIHSSNAESGSAWDGRDGGQNRTLGTSLSIDRGRSPVPFGSPIAASLLQQVPVLFPAPSSGFSPGVPFTFDPMRALSAPRSALSFIQIAPHGAPVELYGVNHPCTHTLLHPEVMRAQSWGPFGGRAAFSAWPFMQGLQATSRNSHLQSSGLYGESYLREVKLDVGNDTNRSTPRQIEMKTERVFHLYRDHFAEGVATYYSVSLQRLLLLLLTWRSGVVYVIDYETFECVGTFKVKGLEGWGFVSSLDLTLYRNFQNMKQHTAAAKAAARAALAAAENADDPSANSTAATAAKDAAAVAAAAAAEEEAARVRLLEHAKKQQLWVTTGGPELLEVLIQPIEEALAGNLSAVSAALKQGEQQVQQQQQPQIKETRHTSRCRKELGTLRLKRAAIVHCLDQVLVGLNELDYNKERKTLIANLYGLPVLVEIDPKTGACQALISLSGVAVVEKHHDEANHVANGVAIPFEGWGASVGGGASKVAPWLYIAGKEWPAMALVQLRQLRVGDSLGFEMKKSSSDLGLCEEPFREDESQQKRPFLEVHSFTELSKQLPHFLSTRRMRRWQ